MIRKKKDNFLDYIPVINPVNDFDEKENGNITVHMKNKGFFHKIAQILFFTPEVSHIDLDEYGSFLWKQMDGSKTVNDLAILLKQEYGELVEPLYQRLVQYMRILKNNKFIILQKRKIE